MLQNVRRILAGKGGGDYNEEANNQKKFHRGKELLQELNDYELLKEVCTRNCLTCKTKISTLVC
jgi:hypothetical protein